MARRIAKTLKTVIKAQSSVELILLERAGAAPLYAVCYPAKLGGGRETQQFLEYHQAQYYYCRMVGFFSKKEAH